MDAVMVERKCTLEEVFAGSFIELIALAPRNPVVRGLILAQTRKEPGPECATFEQIKEWVETTCEKRRRPAEAARVPSRPGITVKVEFSETEYGRAHYSVDCVGSDELSLTAEELLEMIQDVRDAAGNLDDVVEKIAEEIDDNAWNRCEPDMDDYGDYDYSDFDSSGTEDAEVEFSKEQVRERLVAFLREQHPELLEALT